MFYLLDYFTRPSEKFRFQKKEVLPDTTGNILVLVSSKMAVKILTETEGINFFERSFNFNKLHENYDTKCTWHFFFR